MNIEPRRSYIDTSWGQIHCRTSGSGPGLLLLHSSSGSSRVFRRLMILMKGYRSIAPDLPGFGESATMPAGASIEDVAAHLVSLLDALDIERAHVFGLHSGNKVAAALAANWPDRVASLVIAGITHSLVIGSAERNEAMLRYAGRGKDSVNAGKKSWGDLCAKLDSILCETGRTATTSDVDCFITESIYDHRDGQPQ